MRNVNIQFEILTNERKNAQNVCEWRSWMIRHNVSKTVVSQFLWTCGSRQLEPAGRGAAVLERIFFYPLVRVHYYECIVCTFVPGHIVNKVIGDQTSNWLMNRILIVELSISYWHLVSEVEYNTGRAPWRGGGECWPEPERQGALWAVRSSLRARPQMWAHPRSVRSQHSEVTAIT